MTDTTKAQKRIIEDTRKAMLNLSMVFDDIQYIFQALEKDAKTDAAVWGAVYAFDLGRSVLQSVRMGLSITHFKEFIKNPDQYYAWQMKGAEQGMSGFLRQNTVWSK